MNQYVTHCYQVFHIILECNTMKWNEMQGTIRGHVITYPLVHTDIQPQSCFPILQIHVYRPQWTQHKYQTATGGGGPSATLNVYGTVYALVLCLVPSPHKTHGSYGDPCHRWASELSISFELKKRLIGTFPHLTSIHVEASIEERAVSKGL